MRTHFVKSGRHWHRLLLWPALLALFVFVLSGLTHPLLTWTGPQPAQTQPPRAVFSANSLAALPALFRQHAITTAATVKLVPAAHGNLLQVTTDLVSPRRYFDPATYSELPDYDKTQAVWLARHYSGRQGADILAIDFQTAFNSDYPPVNRLLPVYRVRFAGDDALTVSVHTETNALADINNNWKRGLQAIFQQLHTFRFLEPTGHGRVLLMLMLLSSLLGAVLAGAALLYAIRRRTIPQTGRRWHRYLAHIVWIPLFGFTASGIYHLLYQQYGAQLRGLALAPPLPLAQATLATQGSGLDALQGETLSSLSLVAAPEGTLYYRASFPALESAQAQASRNERFNGIPTESSGVFVHAATGVLADMNDQRFARQLAIHHLQLQDNQLSSGERIHRFGPSYDFRNKRLPVWQFDTENRTRDRLFIDPATGVLVDRVSAAARGEGWSFSVLHKWNFLTHSIGRENRDVLMVFVLSLGLAMATLGLRMRNSRR